MSQKRARKQAKRAARDGKQARRSLDRAGRPRFPEGAIVDEAERVRDVKMKDLLEQPSRALQSGRFTSRPNWSQVVQVQSRQAGKVARSTRGAPRGR